MKNVRRALLGMSLVLVLGAAGAEDGTTDKREEAQPLERIARRGVEAVLSFLLETQVTVGSVRLDQDANLLELTHLHIANPRGFGRDTPAMAFETIRVEAPWEVLFAPEPVVQTIHIQGGTVHAELNPMRGINLKKLMDSADRFKGPQLLPEKRWVVEHGQMEDFTLSVTTRLLRAETRERHVESIEMSIKGQEGRGLRASEAITRVLGRLIDELDLLNLDDPLIPLGELLRR